MAYTTDYQTNNFDGLFNVEIANAEVKQYNETDYISLRLKVLDGKYKGSVIFDSIWKNDEGEWHLKKMNNYSLSLRIEAGTTFHTIEEWCNYIKGGKLQANVIINERNNRQKVTFVKPYEAVEEDESYETTLNTIIDDDLPF